MKNTLGRTLYSGRSAAKADNVLNEEGHGRFSQRQYSVAATTYKRAADFSEGVPVNRVNESCRQSAQASLKLDCDDAVSNNEMEMAEKALLHEPTRVKASKQCTTSESCARELLAVLHCT